MGERETRASTASTPLGPWLTAAEAAKYLGLPSQRAVYQAVRRGQLPAHRLGRRLRFHLRDLDGCMQA